MKQRLRHYLHFISGKHYHIKGPSIFGLGRKLSAGMKYTSDRSKHAHSNEAQRIIMRGSLDIFHAGTPKIVRYKFRKYQQSLKTKTKQTIYNSH